MKIYDERDGPIRRFFRDICTSPDPMIPAPIWWGLAAGTGMFLALHPDIARLVFMVR